MRKLRAYLQLVRLPAVFTAMADIFLGFLLNHNSLGDDPKKFGLLLAASSCLYLAGMAFNDFFDRERDAAERPNRPIPSGRISPRTAAVLATALMLAGIAQSAVCAKQSLYVAFAISMCVLAYDGGLKRTPLGPLAMGGCRFLNVMLGASAFDRAFTVWATPQTYLAAALGVYIAGVTWFARDEARTSRRAQLEGAFAIINLGLIAIGAFAARQVLPSLVPVMARVAGTGVGEGSGPLSLLLLAVIIFTINRRLVAALRSPSPENVQRAVKVMLLSLVSLDATLVYFKTGNPEFALATVALLLPAAFLGRWIFIT